MKPGILNGKQKSVASAVIDVGMPVTGWGHKDAARLPVDSLSIVDRSIGLEFGAHQGVTAGIAGDDEIQGHRLVAVGGLERPSRHHPVHGPQHVGHGAGGWQVAVGQQQAEPIAIGTAGVAGQGIELRLQPIALIARGQKTWLSGFDPEIRQQGSVVDPIEHAAGLCF